VFLQVIGAADILQARPRPGCARPGCQESVRFSLMWAASGRNRFDEFLRENTRSFSASSGRLRPGSARLTVTVSDTLAKAQIHVDGGDEPSLRGRAPRACRYWNPAQRETSTLYVPGREDFDLVLTSRVGDGHAPPFSISTGLDASDGHCGPARRPMHP